MTIEKVELGVLPSQTLSIETGKIALEAGGSVVVRLGDTIVLATATASAAPREGIDFFPLLVDFEEKLYAAGRIPGGFFKREGRPSEKSILNSRKVDRPIRPLFPDGYKNDVQIVVTPLSVDQENPPDIIGIIGASAALTLSSIPFEGPIGAARIGRINSQLVINPTLSQMRESDIDIVIAGTKDKVLMIEAQANEATEADVFSAIKAGHVFVKQVIELQEKLVKKAGKPKIAVEPHKVNQHIEQFIAKSFKKKIEEALKISDKNTQIGEIKKIEDEIKAGLEKDSGLKEVYLANPKDIKKVIEEIEYDFIRDMILNQGKRVDGRGLKDIRKLSCEVGVLPRAHGSSLFSRGQTQILNIVTLGSAGEEQMLEGLDLEETGKRYMHHYNFPAFSVGEVRPLRGPGRREIGHGALAEKALLPVLPTEKKFPYTIRLVSETMGSNGSTSMASTCASTLALMDAGVQISSPVAGISIGLITSDPSTSLGASKKWVTITDIQGLEDHLGDMDFKVTGTRKGITAIQVDIKTKGLSFEVVEKALTEAREARYVILDKMAEAIAKPRADLSPYAPRIISIKINPEKIGMVIGPGGKNIKKLIEETGTQIDIEDDGTVLITTSDPEAAKAARSAIEAMTFEPKIGDVFSAKIVRIMPFGAFAEIPGGKDGLVHISQLSDRRVAKVEDVVNLGDEVIVKVQEIDDMGRINLTMKGVTEADKNRLHS
ncbi:polyribonucleotide nucleotidyltransferase [Candidatus Saganbacteria bacterium]|nr:polyribonucleotide nucleotidyltransferase [Candidatus Saganbacteria bacterium]